MKILLTGIMGSGKSTIGKLLADRLGFKFIELDDYAVKLSGFTHIDEIFNQRPSLWKEVEFEACRHLSAETESMVIACSGDIVENQLNLLYFREKNPTQNIYIETSAEIVVKRLKGVDKDFYEKEDKILLERINSLLEKRRFLYESLADKIINTDKLSIAEGVKEIETFITK